LQDYKASFLRLAVKHGVLKFGEFKLKSGRISPYFFNLGLISSGVAVRELGRSYAHALMAAGVDYNLLFGPAYKGIPLVTTVAIALSEHGTDVPYAYNRKEAKDHGEGGVLVGAPVRGRVVIIDDVLTAGTALREAVTLVRGAGAHPVAAIIALDRQEVGPSGESAVAEMEKEQGLRIISLVNVADVLEFLAEEGSDPATLEGVKRYQARYGVQVD
jgi:orotate phosphoribosyltransferase